MIEKLYAELNEEDDENDAASDPEKRDKDGNIINSSLVETKDNNVTKRPYEYLRE